MHVPNFLVLGAPKCGTTSLYYYLQQHPQVFLCRKEIHFFAVGDPLYQDIATTTWDDYLKLFDTAGDAKAVGEVAVRYLSSETALRNIQRLMPSGKLIAMLRDPAERAFSHFLMRFRTGGFRSAESSTMPTEQDIRHGFDSLEHDYVARGRYALYLKRYYEAFPRSNVKVVLLEDLSSRADETMQSIFEFLDVDPKFHTDTDRQYNVSTLVDYSPLRVRLRQNRFLRSLRSNKSLRKFITMVAPRRMLDDMQWRPKAASQSVRQAVTMPADVRLRLIDFYASEIDELETLLGRDLSFWRSATPPRTEGSG